MYYASFVKLLTGSLSLSYPSMVGTGNNIPARAVAMK